MISCDQKKQTIIKVFWVFCVVICITAYFIDSSFFSNNELAEFIGEFSGYAWGAYFLIHMVRGLIFLPSTPLIFAGVLLFPDQLAWVLIVSLIGILSSSLLIYYFSDKLGFSSYFKSKNAKLKFIETKLSGKHGFYYILLWSFLPIVPTDLICFVSGALRLKLPVFISALFFGELILCSIYIFGTSMILN